MPTVETVHLLSDLDRALVDALVAKRDETTGHSALSEQKRFDMSESDSSRFTAFLARGKDGKGLIGYAQLSSSHHYDLELVVDQDHVVDARHLEEVLLRTALDEVARRGGGAVQLFVPLADATSDDLARAADLVPSRDLYQMRRSLKKSDRFDRSTFELRSFQPGRDEDAWLKVNARSFEDHAEQGAYDLSSLKERESAPWFDREGLLLLYLDDALAGFCWTKVEPQTPQFGEIYVIGVDPGYQRRGLGRALLSAGLSYLSSVEVSTVTLYVDASNVAAIAMYRSFGFEIDHIDRVYGGEIHSSR